MLVDHGSFKFVLLLLGSLPLRGQPPTPRSPSLFPVSVSLCLLRGRERVRP